MRILLVHRHFWPDATTYAVMLRQLGARLAGEGHAVTVISAQPSYNDIDIDRRPRREKIDGVDVIRVPLFPERKRQRVLRIVNALLFGAQVALHVIFRRQPYDIMSVSTFPPIVMGTVARAASRIRRTGYVYHCLDLYPEIAVRSGVLADSLATRLMRRMDTSTCRRAVRNVVLSSDMAGLLADRGLDSGNVEIINNFLIHTPPDEDVISGVWQPGEAGRILFAGNMGRFQGLDLIIDSAGEIDPDVAYEFLFLGAGEMVESLRQRAADTGNRRITFHGQVSVEAAARVMSEADIGVVSLLPGVAAAAYPSKLMTYLAAGCRIVAIVEDDTEIARFVTDNDLGTVADPRTAGSIVTALQTEISRPRPDAMHRNETKRIAQAEYGRDVILDRWSRLFADLDREMHA